MGDKDRAIVVGVNRYPSLGDLEGPENDAKEFVKWLTDKDGGSVPKANIECILSSDFKVKNDPVDAEPTTAELERAFDQLHVLGDKNGGKAGDRLYIYLAGHGFAPAFEDVALLMANAARGRSGHHVSGRTYANWFRQSAFFDEVVLFMDCCREHNARASVRSLPFEPLTAATPARHIYGFATEWSRASRERKIGANGQVQGLFTVALLAGLRGGATRNASGQVTAKTLVEFVHPYLARLTKQAGLECQNPEFIYCDSNPIVFSSTPPVRFRLRLQLSAAETGKAVELRDGTFQLVPGNKLSPSLWEWDLPPGMYNVAVQGGPSKVLELIGEGGEFDASI